VLSTMGNLHSLVHLLVVCYPSFVVSTLCEKLPVAPDSKLRLPPRPPLLLLVISVVSSLWQMILQISTMPFYLCDGIMDYLFVCVRVALAQLYSLPLACNNDLDFIDFLLSL
jgi:hypothetical protein